MKKFFKICIYITLSVLSVMGIRLLCCDRLKIIPIEGQLGFTDTYIPDVSLCIPAAYTGFHDDIEGEYRINGKTYGSQSLKERVSIHPQKGLLISRNWLSDTGFQQHVLVKDGKVRSFRDKRRFRRRALCCSKEDPAKLFIIQSRDKMTMNEFASEISKYSYNAVNLDMGRWGYGWVGKKILCPWTIVFRHWQTNWIYCKS